jgi:hypothetical protein
MPVSDPAQCVSSVIMFETIDWYLHRINIKGNDV